MSSMEDPLNLTNEIITILASNDNKESLEKSEIILIEKLRLYEEQDISVRDAIRQLTDNGREALALASADNDSDNSTRIGELEHENTATNKKIEKIENDIRLLEKACQDKDEEGECLKLDKYLMKTHSRLY
jgi:DNA-binding transcriptional MerR regulator